jgi:imidazolonepropionase-like amidohydrolase
MRLITTLLVVAISGLSTTAFAQDLAVVDATVYVSPQAAPQSHATVLIQHGKIVSVGKNIAAPHSTQTVHCVHCVVFAGFWNSHVHFTGPQWIGAAHITALQLSQQMQAMLTHSGFTTVVDTASDPQNTVDIRHRIEDGEVLGPRIYTAGAGLYPPHGIPYYLADLPKEALATLPQPGTPSAATDAVDHNRLIGTDIVKLFTGSYLSPYHIVHMPIEIAQAAVTEGHRNGQLVFAHPSDLEGIRVAMDSGVDVLAHAPDTVDGVDEVLIKQLVDHHVAMIPTLKLFSGSRHIVRIREIVAQFHALGGTLVFGTDTGFLTDYDVTEEYRQLALAGLTFRDILAMLTTNPASEFRVSSHTGTITAGSDGDLTILSSNPESGDPTAFANVLFTIRNGQVIFQRNAE